MISAVELEKRVTGASILDIIISKLSYKKKPYPIILFEVDKAPKVGLHFAILSLGIAICLKMESS